MEFTSFASVFKNQLTRLPLSESSLNRVFPLKLLWEYLVAILYFKDLTMQVMEVEV